MALKLRGEQGCPLEGYPETRRSRGCCVAWEVGPGWSSGESQCSPCGQRKRSPEGEPRRGFIFPARAVAQGPLGGEEEAPDSCGNTVGGTCPVIHLVPPDDWSGSCGVCGCPGGAFLSEEESQGVCLTLRGQQSLAGGISARQTTSSVSCPALAGHPLLPLRAVGNTQGQVRLS